MRGSIGSGPAWLLTASLIAAACTSAPPIATGADVDPNGEITTPVAFGIPARIDPQNWNETNHSRHSAMVFEPLMTFDAKTLTPIPAAAKEPPRISDDGLTYVFALRDGLTYSDGSSLTARDFVYAFSRLCAPGSRGVGFFARIVAGCQDLRRMDAKTATADGLLAANARLGLRANGDKEVVVTLTEPAAWFTAIAATPLGHPLRESDVTRAGASYGSDPATFIGNGPFKLVEKTDQKLVFERNERYRLPVKLKRWTKVVVDRNVAFAAYRNSEIDVFGGVPGGRALAVTEHIDVIEADPELRAQIVDVPGAFSDFYILNVSLPPFTDKKVRQAFAKAIDREDHIRGTRLGEVSHSMIPPGWPGHDPADTFQRFDADKARELLASSTFAGRPELSSVKITYPSIDPGSRDPAEVLQHQLKRTLGIEIGIEAVDGQTLDQMYASPRTAPQIQFVRRCCGALPDPQNWLTTAFHSSGFALQVGYKNADLDALLTQADRERDPRRRADLYQRASRIVSEDVPAIFLWWGPSRYLQKPRVKGLTGSPMDSEYGILRVAEIYVTKKG